MMYYKYNIFFIYIYFLIVIIFNNHLSFCYMKKLPKELSEKLDEIWCMYKANYNKDYTKKEEKIRRIAWENNLLAIYEHNLKANAGLYTYFLRDNHLTDLTTQEYNKKWVKLKKSRKRKVCQNNIVGAVLDNLSKIPESIDWREKGFNTKTINQDNCGSCYAFSIAGSIQGQIFKKTNKIIDLSVQQLVDCSSSTGNFGCSGGSLKNTLRYLEKEGGLMEESSYPYTAKESSCKYQQNLGFVNVTSWGILPARDERRLEVALVNIGPIAVSINASPKTFQAYGEGIYDDPACSSDQVNHAMLLVGFTKEYWILKNWWGDDWGKKGYMYLAKKKNRCGIANYAAFASIEIL